MTIPRTNDSPKRQFSEEQFPDDISSRKYIKKWNLLFSVYCIGSTIHQMRNQRRFSN